MDKNIALCKGNQYVRINKCKDFIDQTICKQNKRDECTIQILEKNNAQCKMIKEKNPPFINYGNGNIIISGLNILNNEILDGDFLIYFKPNITLNNEEYINIKETMVKILHKKHKENLDILEYLESQSEYKFNNLDEISSIFVPIEQNPIKATFITILIITLLITITKLLLEFRVRRRNILYQRALIQCQKDHEERKQKLQESKL